MRKLLFGAVLILLSVYSQAQINENYSAVNNYLYRMAQKGLIVLDDNVTPLDRTVIIKAFEGLTKNVDKLSKTEKAELEFYLREYYYDKNNKTPNISPSYLFYDKAKRFRTFAIKENKTSFFVDPLIGASYGTLLGKSNLTSFGGLRAYGYLSNKVGYSITFRDITERGDSIDYIKNFSEIGGVVNTSRHANQLNYSQLNFNLGYKFKNGLITVAKDNLNWGYGLGGKIILSSKAASFPYIKLDYQLTSKIKFTYFNAWLNSNLVDSSRSYYTNTGIAGGYREVYRSKFLAMHSLDFLVKKGLNISIGESVMYSDKMDVGYLVPINIFKLYDQYTSQYSINGGSNTQIFFQVSSRNQIPKTHFYLTCFIDEMRLGKIFDKVESRNQAAFTAGINKTDFLVNYLTLGLEYTRINPFVYNNIIPAQTYKNANYNLGDWMGSNADRLLVFLNYTPVPRCKINLTYQAVRKGADGTLEQQYNQQPQQPFLFGNVLSQKRVTAKVSYELLNKLNLFLNFSNVHSSYLSNTQKGSDILIGFNYGL